MQRLVPYAGPPKLQEDYIFDAAPGSGVKNSVVAEIQNVKVLTFAAYANWTVQPTPLELYATIDGIEYQFSVVNPITATWYFPAISGQVLKAAQSLTTTDYCLYKPFMFECRKFKLEAEITGGTVSKLYCLCRLAKY